MTAKSSIPIDCAQDSTSDILLNYTHSEPGSIPGTISIADHAKLGCVANNKQEDNIP